MMMRDYHTPGETPLYVVESTVESTGVMGISW